MDQVCLVRVQTDSTPSVLSIRQKKIDFALTSLGSLFICNMNYFSHFFGFWPLLVGILATFENWTKFLEMEKMRRHKCIGTKTPISLGLSKKRILKLPLFFGQFFRNSKIFWKISKNPPNIDDFPILVNVMVFCLSWKYTPKNFLFYWLKSLLPYRCICG